MNFNIINLNEKYFYLKIENLFNSKELYEIWEEINFLSYRSKLLFDTESAKDIDGKIKSNKLGFFLKDAYDKKISNYLKYYKKWNTENLQQLLLKNNLGWRSFIHTKYDETLLSYYEDTNFYEEHFDFSTFTQLFWTFKEPKQFQGGDLIFVDFDHQINIKNNMLVLFPSWFKHKVTPVTLNNSTPSNVDKLNCNGRFVFTTFYLIR